LALAAAAGSTPIWTQRFDGFGGEDQVLLLRNTADGGALQLLKSYDPATFRHLLLIQHYSAVGTWLWTQPGGSFAPDPRLTLEIAGDGSAVLAVTTFDRLIMRKFDGDSGQIFWERERMLDVSDDANQLDRAALARDEATQSILVAVADQDDYLILRYGEDGNPLSEVRWGVPDSVDVPTAVLPVSGGGFVVTGYEHGVSNVSAYRTLGYNSAGAQQFSDRQISPPGNLFTPAWLAGDTAGNIWVLGGPEAPCGIFNYEIWKLDASGQRQWLLRGPPDSCVIGAAKSAKPLGMTLLADGSVIVVSDATFNSVGIERINAAGQRVWERNWTGPGTAVHATPRAFASNAQGRTRVVGSVNLRFAFAEWTADGSLCAEGSNGDANGDAIQVMGSGWIVGAQSVFTQSTNTDAILARYPGATCGSDLLMVGGFEF